MADFDRLLQDNLQWIYSKARYFKHNILDAEDLAGETICRAYRFKERYDNKAEFRPWITVIMRNIHISQLRSQRIEIDRNAIAENVIRASEDAETQIGNMIALLKSMSRRNRYVFAAVCRAWGLSYNEICRRQNILPATARSRVSIGRAHIRNMLKD